MPRTYRICFLALILTVVLVPCSVIVFAAFWPVGRGVIAQFTLLVTSPGMYASSWFLRTHHVSPHTRLLLQTGASILIEWPVVFLLLESALDYRRIVKAITATHVSMSLGIGAVTSVLTWKLATVAPLIFKVFTVPHMILVPFITMFGFRASNVWRDWDIPMRLFGGSISYGFIAFLVLYRLFWRKGVATAVVNAP